MGGTAFRLEGDSSRFQENSRVVDCAPQVLEAIRAMVLERFNSTPHGGTEFAGVLFGSHTGDEVHITAFRPLANGGAFTYAATLAEDQRALADVMAEARTSGELAGLELMGWFRAHPRSGLDLSRRDLEISTALFPESWQVALVMRPGNSALTRARFYLRDTEGPWQAECPFRELALPAPAEPLIRSEARPGEPTAPAKLPAAQTEPGAQLTRSEDIRQLVKALERPAKARPTRRLALAWPVTLIIVLAALVGSLYWWMRPEHIALRLFDTAGQLRITWDGTTPLVRNGHAAHLEITDGSQKLWLELAREQLRSGNMAYTRRSSNVTVRMVVQPEGGAPVEEVASFIGPVDRNQVESAQAQAPGETGSRERSQNAPPVNAPPLVVQVPVEQAPPPKSPPQQPRPRFAVPPTTKAAQIASVTVPQAPEMAASSSAARETPMIAPPPVRMEPPPEKAVPVRPAPSSSTVAGPAAASLPARAPAVVPRAPTSGRVIWIGRLQKNQQLAITGKNCSTGTLVGELPGRPFKFSVSPGDLSGEGIVLYTSNMQYANSVVEPPGAENGWNRTVYTWNPKYANDAVVIESPPQPSQWNRIVLRGKNPKISVIVIDWTLIN